MVEINAVMLNNRVNVKKYTKRKTGRESESGNTRLLSKGTPVHFTERKRE